MTNDKSGPALVHADTLEDDAAVLAILAASDGDSKIGMVQPETGATIQTQRDFNRRVVNVMDYIDKTMWSAIESGDLGTQNSALVASGITKAVNAAIARRKRLKMNGGSYLHDAFSINGPVEIEGEGRDATKMHINSINANGIVINSSEPCAIRSMTLNGQNTSTSGDILQVNGSVPTEYNSYSEFSNLIIAEGWNGFHGRSAGGFILKDSYLVNCKGALVYVENQASPDNGDSTISGCILANANGIGKNIVQTGSGGLRIINNKGLGGTHFYQLTAASGVATSILIATGNSAEGFTQSGFSIGSTGGTLGNVLITSNEITVIGTNCHGVDLSSQQNINVSSNVFRLGGSNECGVVVGAASEWLLSGNSFQANSGNTGYGIQVGASSGSGIILQQKFAGFSTNVQSAASSTLVQNFSSLGTLSSQNANSVNITGGVARVSNFKVISAVAKTGTDAGAMTVSSSDVTNPLQLLMGFGPGKNYITSIEQGVAYRPLILNESGGSVQVGKGDWQNPVFLGARALWFTSTGQMRSKAGAPSSETDGVGYATT